ncbi:hypothetical protein GCM10027447_21530 [Glycomyces halotolerans]
MEFKQPFKGLGALAAAGTVGLAGALILAAPAQAEESEININPGNVPTTASGHTDLSCDQVPGGEPLDGEDGWVFVLPGNDGEFKSVTAQFDDLNGDSQTYTTDADGGIDTGNGTSKAYIITPEGWTLTGASAVVEGTSRTQFNLTHACPAGFTPPPDGETTPPGDGETTPPGDGETSPGEEPTSPGAEETSPGEASTSPASSDDALSQTGAPLTVALVSAAALAAAGGALFFMMRRRRAAENW